ncbi:MAG: hypothetical protein A2447_01690 [Omnitrophica WOR_2 bacterium RIFOXYC2_FULL_38_12]|nr:MAG: hypothetical protein A2447_01690 [Omnitrophica WOR_2 bacterium RIFOXYC2_FULL_38_12]
MSTDASFKTSAYLKVSAIGLSLYSIGVFFIIFALTSLQFAGSVTGRMPGFIASFVPVNMKYMGKQMIAALIVRLNF